MNDESPVLLRLNSLMKAGYEIQKSSTYEVMTAVWLEHPAVKRVAHKDLILHECGLVTSSGLGSTVHILAEEEKEFRTFVRDIPKPTFWEKPAMVLREIQGFVVIAAVMAVAWIIAMTAIEGSKSLISSLF